MAGQTGVRGWGLIALRAVVCVAGCLVGLLFARGAPQLYDSVSYYGRTPGDPELLRMPASLLGAGSGFLAGFAWSGLMIRKSLGYIRRLGEAPARLMAWGVLLGIGVGMGSAAALHIGLMVIIGSWDWDLLAFGMAFGAAGGLMTGLVCGGLALAVASAVASRLARTSRGGRA